MNSSGGKLADSTQMILDQRGMSDLLAQIPIFTDLPRAEIHHLTDALNWREVPAGTILFNEGEPGQSLTILVDGQIEVVQAMNTPDEHILAVVKTKGDFLGEMSMFYRDGIRSASARTFTDVQLLELQRADFDKLLHRRPELAIGILKQLSARLRNSEDATIKDLQEKNRQLLQAYQELKAAQEQLIVKEKLEHDLRMARRIQESILLKEMPVVPGYHLSAFWNPARAVSGDFYDFVVLPDNQLYILIGDVTDKGLPAALVMATTRSVLRVVAKKRVSPGEVLRQVNELLWPDMPSKMFVTCLCAVLDISSGHIVFANAGHDLPYQITASGLVELRATGFPLGILPGIKYDEAEAVLSPGDKLLLYSDGLVEAHNPQGEMFGFSRLKKIMAENPNGEPDSQPGEQAMINFLNHQLHQFTGPGWEQEDDVTMVVVERFND